MTSFSFDIPTIETERLILRAPLKAISMRWKISINQSARILLAARWIVRIAGV